MSYDSSRFPRNKPVVQTACEGIQQLIEQLTLKDNPPINWKDQSALSEKKAFSNINQDATKEKSDTQSDNLGHLSLIALSKWTLQTAGYPLPQETSENTEPYAQSFKNQLKASSPSNRHIWRKAVCRLPKDSKSDPFVAKAWKHQFGSEYAKHLYEASHCPSESEPTRLQFVRLRKKRNNSRETCIRTIEDADLAIQTGALVDICVTADNAPSPTGFFRVSQSASGRPFGHNNMYLNIKKEPNWDRAAQRPCITALCLIFPDRKEVVPRGFQLVRHANSKTPADFGMDGERIFWCFRLSREGNPLTDIVPLIPRWGEAVPSGYTVVEKSPQSHTASFSTVISDVTRAGLSQREARKNIKIAVFLAYRQRLTSLECLRPHPLLTAIQQKRKGQNEANTLESYFGTGGTVVSSSVGRYHILDRSTHELLGTMSVKHRLKLIDASRQKCSESGQDLVGGFYGCASLVPHSRSEDASSMGGSTLLSAKSIDGGSAANPSTSTSRTTQIRRILAVGETVESVKVTDFIPFPEVAKGLSEDREQALVRLPIRTALLVPILSACYTRHGGAALLAVEILTKLLTKTSMFDDDVDTSDDHDGESCLRLTLLDLCVQAVCDVATSGAEETAFSACVQFAELAIQFSQGQLSTRTIGLVYRMYFFVFSFGNGSNWFSQTSKTVSGSNECKTEDFDVPLLLDCRGNSGRQSSILPGGAPQVAALALKNLVYFCVRKLGKKSSAGFWVGYEMTNKNDVNFDIARKRSSTSVDDEVDCAILTELALHQVQRSGGSEMFWHDMVTTCGRTLFGRDEANVGDKGAFPLVFSLFANIIKTSSGKLRTKTRGSSPRDLMCKLLSLELLLHFLECLRDEQEASTEVENAPVRVISSRDMDVLTFSVRRMVAACLLWNTEASHESQFVYKRVLRIISEFWCSPIHRKRCKVETGILVEHFVVRLLEMGPHFLGGSGEQKHGLYLQLTELLIELKKWFARCPIDTIEFFLSYDKDFSLKKVGSGQDFGAAKLRLLQRISLGICKIAETCSKSIGKQTPTNRSLKDRVFCERVDHNMLPESLHPTEAKSKMRDSATTLRALSLDTIAQIVKSLTMSAALSVELPFSKLLLSWDLADDFSALSHLKGSVSSKYNSDLSDNDITNDRSPCPLNNENDSSAAVGPLDDALQLAKDRGIDKAIEYLIDCNVIMSTPRDVAHFLLSNREKLDASVLGNYISEEGVGDAQNEFKKTVLYLFVRAISFVGLNVDQG
ncbi:hypothetical protein FisN_20Hu138 [Fistulifera solaris]|uniref:MABP domain-containing protein n=1 Tax=Fistulifera solaris TaxID=1519565 RepID=A0A1Z5KCA5_FISSO|nr:hypothetical protein FisN_20Hu138 [Fistulifera solaris]|eukprot:GAX23930.1 hypothetical protein FisN_20Hu138 [Fistulifera solaris]